MGEEVNAYDLILFVPLGLGLIVSTTAATMCVTDDNGGWSGVNDTEPVLRMRTLSRV